MNEQPILFVDMDGTTARFYEPENCLEAMYNPGYFEHLRPYEEVVYAIRLIMEHTNIRVIIISTYPADRKRAKQEKIKWLQRTFHEKMPEYIIVPIPTSKPVAAESYLQRKLNKHDWLLDDYSVNLRDWELHNGNGIKCMNEVQNETDFLSFDGPRINTSDNAHFLYNTILRLINGQSKTVPIRMRVQYTHNNNVETVLTEGPIQQENGQIIIPGIPPSSKTVIPLARIKTIDIVK